MTDASWEVSFQGKLSSPCSANEMKGLPFEIDVSEVPHPVNIDCIIEPGDFSDLDDSSFALDTSLQSLILDYITKPEIGSGEKSRATVEEERINVGQHVLVKHGSKVIPAVVVEWPWIQYFVPHKGLWKLSETKFTIMQLDVVRKLASPNIQMLERYICYNFTDL